MTEKGEKILTAAAVAFLLLALFIMGYVRIFTEYDNAGEQTEAEAASESIQEEYFVEVEGMETDIVIPLPDSQAKGSFQIEESLKDKTLEIVLQDVDEDYYYEHKVQGNGEKISQIRYQQRSKESSLLFVLEDIYIADVQVEGDAVWIKLQNPVEQYDRLVVLEGDCWEKSVTDRLETEDIKGLLTGDVATANALRSDFFISMSVETVAAEESIIIYYNDDYYIPEFDSRDLAELLEAKFADRYGKQNVIIEKAEDGDLAETMLPAVKVVCRMGALKEGETLAAARESFNKENGMLIADVLIGQYQEMEEKQ